MGQKQIVVASNGWVFIGQVTIDGSSVIITETQNIRRWGTTRGLGEIALNGMPKDAQCDDYGVVRIPISQVLFTIDCEV